MNCLLEALASVWLAGRRRVMTEPPEEEVMTAQEGLEQCRRNMEARERELQGLMHRLSEDALVKRKAGDVLTARSKLLERKRVQKRLERLRHGLDLVDTQLDAIKTAIENASEHVACRGRGFEQRAFCLAADYADELSVVRRPG